MSFRRRDGKTSKLRKIRQIRPDIFCSRTNDDVATVPAAKLRSRAGVVLSGKVGIEPPLEQTIIAGGDYAVLRHKGPYADMKAAYDWLYGQWLPQSGREPARAPNLEEYLNSPRDTSPTELLSDIYLPLA